MASTTLFAPGCEDAASWAWVLDVLVDVIKLADAAIGKYEARNTGNDETDVEVTTSALTEADSTEVDKVTQVASVPSDGKTYEILTPDASKGGLMAPEPGKYKLQGVIPVANAQVYSSVFTVTA
ncbi:MAG: hypothetical protein U0441_20165 [Polyangiaceae bacterium]